MDFFGCGAKGHWSRECTKQEKKISENLESILSFSNLVHDNEKFTNFESPVGRLRSWYNEWVGGGGKLGQVRQC